MTTISDFRHRSATDYWSRLRDAAFAYAERGWPIAPGVQPVPRLRNGWPVPSLSVPYHGPMGANAVAMYWQREPYELVVGTGLHCMDVFSLRQPVAADVLDDLGHRNGPVAALPSSQWLFFVDAGDPPSTELLSRSTRYHGPGDWVPLPPTRMGRQPITWIIEPAAVGWRLFPRECVHHALHSIRARRRQPSKPAAQT